MARSIDWFLKLGLLIIIVGMVVPFSPKMPAANLDSSWAMGLNQAVAQGLSFGKQIIFTLGPYSSIYSKMYHPSTDLMMIGGSLYLAISYWLSIVLLMKGIQWRWTVAFCVLLFGMIYSRDALFFSYPLLVGLVSYKIVVSKDWSLVPHNLLFFFVALLFAPFGLLPLIKGTLLILCISEAVLCAVFFAIHQKNRLAFISLAVPGATTALFWIGAGQSLTNLSSYLISSVLLASGFSEAMANEGNNQEIILYLIASALIFLSIAAQKELPTASKIFISCLFFVFLFISFKAGFTRHVGHAFIPGTSILIAAFLLPYLFKLKYIFLSIIFSIYTWSYINGHHAKISIHNDFISNYSSAWYGLKNRIQDKTWLSQNYGVITNYLRAQAAFPLMQGTADIYSYGQAYLISSNIDWLPRPVFQSYSVFTPLMADENKKHLLSEQRPDNIIFKVEPVDGRIPSLEDGSSWPMLMAYYHPTDLVNHVLFLHKNRVNKAIRPLTLLATEKHAFGEIVKIPEMNQPIFAEIEIKPTVWGMLATTFLKPMQLQITLELKDGTKKQYRIIANMAKAGFMLSPLVESTDEFALLYKNNNQLDTKRAKSFVIASGKSKTLQWKADYIVKFKLYRV